ncbi:elongator complex protein 3 [Peptostreptococcus faecalis]|uniref:elongator complex protein 3 n=1 Tax=Peptostreptococcus faecalis TaxID=2045015 RepID=UPI000C7A700B|nr:radical SAM protein [Peptostreptococcus faecalis]
MKKKIIPIFVPHQGCPHDCIFCNQKKITGISTDMTDEKSREIIEEALETIEDNTNIEIAFFGGSFTAIEKSKQIELLSVAREYKNRGIVNDIRLSTRPDCIDYEELSLLKEYGVTVIELGVQSMDEDVLIKSIRGHKKEVVKSSSELIKKAGFKLGLQMMIGLPSDSEEKCIKTAKDFVNIGPDFVRIYPTLVIKETLLEKNYIEGSYIPFSVEKAVDIAKKLMVLFYINNIDVIRVGLQATDDIQMGIDVVAGPYHPAFRELVQSRIIRDYIDIIVPKKFENIIIYSENKNISSIVGNKRCNRKYINEKYKAKFKTVADNTLIDEIKIEVDGKNISESSFAEIFFKLGHEYKLC